MHANDEQKKMVNLDTIYLNTEMSPFNTKVKKKTKRKETDSSTSTTYGLYHKLHESLTSPKRSNRNSNNNNRSNRSSPTTLHNFNRNNKVESKTDDTGISSTTDFYKGYGGVHIIQSTDKSKIPGRKLKSSVSKKQNKKDEDKNKNENKAVTIITKDDYEQKKEEADQKLLQAQQAHVKNRVLNMYSSFDESASSINTSILSKQRRMSSSEKKYVKQVRKNRVKDRKGIYYLQERRNKNTVKKTYSSSRQRAKQQIQRLKNIKERLGKSRIGIYSGKRPAYDPVKNHHYPGEGIQNKTNLRIKKARQVMKEDDKFHYNSPSNLKIYSRKFTEAYLSMEDAH